MDAKMFCFQCEETCANKGCTIRGMCGKEPETANSMDRLIAELKRLAVALENKGMKPDAGTGTFMMQAMFATITNANFDTPRIEEFIRETQERTAKIDPSVPLPPVGVLAEKNEDILVPERASDLWLERNLRLRRSCRPCLTSRMKPLMRFLSVRLPP